MKYRFAVIYETLSIIKVCEINTNLKVFVKQIKCAKMLTQKSGEKNLTFEWRLAVEAAVPVPGRVPVPGELAQAQVRDGQPHYTRLVQLKVSGSKVERIIMQGDLDSGSYEWDYYVCNIIVTFINEIYKLLLSLTEIIQWLRYKM